MLHIYRAINNKWKLFTSSLRINRNEMLNTLEAAEFLAMKKLTLYPEKTHIEYNIHDTCN